MGGSIEDLEPLFDYSRVQPCNFVSLDDDFLEFADGSLDSPPPFPSKRKKLSHPAVEKGLKNGEAIQIIDSEDKEEYDWMPPPPKVSTRTNNHHENSTIKELRLKKQELVSFAQSAGDLFRAVEESVKKEHSNSLRSSAGEVDENPSEPPTERNKIVISIQDKDGQKQFRVYKDDKFERLFKMYADKVKLDLQNMIFCFDGDKISPTATPDGLGMEDDDMIEVHTKPS